MRRRQFLGSAAAAGLSSRWTFAAGTTIALVQDPQDSIAASAAAKWAVRHLENVLVGKGAAVKRYDRAEAATGADLVVFAGSRTLPSGTRSAARAEALALGAATAGKQPLISASGYDARGLVYALLELADRVEHAASPSEALTLSKQVTEQPAPNLDITARKSALTRFSRSTVLTILLFA